MRAHTCKKGAIFEAASQRMDLRAVENYLLRGEYPASFSKAEKSNLRRRCRNNFKLDSGILKYRTAKMTGEKEETEWRICVRTEEEKKRIIVCCHEGMSGKEPHIIF